MIPEADLNLYDHRQAMTYREEARRLRRILAAILMRHPNGLFVPISAIDAEQGDRLRSVQDEMRHGLVFYLGTEEGR